MPLYEFTAPCHFGMEAVLKREIINLGYEIVRVEDGRVSFRGEASAIARANVFLRTAERVLLCVGRFKAYSFDKGPAMGRISSFGRPVLGKKSVHNEK